MKADLEAAKTQQEASLAQLDEGLAAASASLDAAATAKTAEITARLDEVAAVAQAGFAEGMAPLTPTLARITADIDVQRTRLDKAIADFQQQFSAAQEERRKEFDDWVTTVKEDEVSRSAESKAADIAAREQSEARVARMLAAMQEHERQAESLVSQAAVLTVASGHGDYADTEHRAANRWRWFGIGPIALSVAWIVITVVPLILEPSAAQVDYPLMARVLVTTPVFVLAAYVFRQSGQHRTVERVARDTSLKLKALGPYLAQLPEDEQEKAKAELVDRFFGREPAVSAKGASGSSDADTLGTVGKLADSVTKLTDEIP